MKTFTPNDSTAMVAAVHAIYPAALGIELENMIFFISSQQCRDSDNIALWEFHSDGTTGYWAPMIDKDTVSVACPNYYENADMDRLSFGAAVTFMAINHLVWMLHEKWPGSPALKALVKKQDALYDLMYRDNTTLDTSAIYNFLD